MVAKRALACSFVRRYQQLAHLGIDREDGDDFLGRHFLEHDAAVDEDVIARREIRLQDAARARAGATVQLDLSALTVDGDHFRWEDLAHGQVSPATAGRATGRRRHPLGSFTASTDAPAPGTTSTSRTAFAARVSCAATSKWNRRLSAVTSCSAPTLTRTRSTRSRSATSRT